MRVNYLLIFLVAFCNIINAKLYTDENYKYTFDRDLLQRVLDPELCQRQIQYIRESDSLLFAQFIDAGLRVPRAILLGNLQDLGLYPQCLGIHKVNENITIDGKYCLIRVPANQNVRINPTAVSHNWDFNPNMLQLQDDTIKKLEEHKSYMTKLKSVFGNEIEDTRLNQDNPLSSLSFRLALCVPKACTTQEALAGLLFNLTDLGFNYQDEYCRLPGDKPWATADYIAIVVFSLLGLLTLLSTSYDVYQTVIKKRDPKETNVLLISFSAYTNCRRILVMKSNPGVIECLDGVRALAIYWVVIGHVFYILSFFALNPLDTMEWAQSYNSIWLTTGTLTVDTFFLLSGLLLVYTTAGKFTGSQLIKNLPAFYLNRLLRMFPVLAAVILFEASFFNRLGDGPIWGIVSSEVQKCRTFWWTTLLYVQNYVNPTEICLGVTWYLAIDINLHILSPIVLFWVLGRERRLALSALGTALFVSMVIAVAFTYAIQFSDERFDYHTFYYINILTRSPPFFIGMVYGYICYLSRRKNLKIPYVLSTFITAFSIALLAAIIYGKYLSEYTELANNAVARDSFDAFLRPGWALGVGWIIFVCVIGHGGPINWFLSLNIWKIPSRISYSLYLVHASFMIAVYSNSVQPVHFTVHDTMFDFMGFFAILHLISFFMTILIDSPFVVIFKLLLGKVLQKSKARPKREEISKNGNIQEINANGNLHHESSEEKNHKP